MFGKVIFYILISMLLANIKAEGEEIPLGGGMAQVQCEKINLGGQSVPHSSPGRCAGSRKRYRVIKPNQESFCGGRGKRVVRASSHNRRVHKYNHYKKSKNSKRLLDEEKASEVITKKIGSAPILEHYIKRMGVVSVIDRMVGAHRNRHISHGQMVAGLMVYLLNNGRAMYEMEKWAEDTAILSTIFPGYNPGDWTDDRIEDTLDELSKAGLVLTQGAISANIVREFGLNLSDIHYDTTSVSLWGTYDSSTGQPAVLITFGHNKDHRPDLKQVVVGAAVSADGGVPLLSNTHDGNTDDSVLPISYWERLRKLAGKEPFCLIGDCKIASLNTLRTLCSQDGLFLAPMAMSQAEQKKLRIRKRANELDLAPVDLKDEKELRPIYEKLTDRVSNRQKKEKPQKVYGYKVHEDCWQIKDNLNRPYTLRKLIVYSEGLADLNARTRERHLEKAEKELFALRQKLNKRKLITREAIEAAKNKILNNCKVCGFMDADVEERIKVVQKKVGPGRRGPNSKYIIEEKTMYDLNAHRFQEAIEDDALLDGLFLMVTNRDARQWPVSRLLALYKRQYKVERVFQIMKGPLAVSPMLLEKPNRICSMIFIITLTLQLYTLIQRQAAQELLRRNSPLDGLLPNRIKTWRPQTDKLLAAFDNIQLISINGNLSLNVTSLNSVQLEIVKLLGIPVNRYSLNASNIKS